MLIDGTEAYIYIIKRYIGRRSYVEQIIHNYQIAKNKLIKEMFSKIEKVMLSGSNGKENALTENELKLIENAKEKKKTKKVSKENNPVKEIKKEENKPKKVEKPKDEKKN